MKKFLSHFHQTATLGFAFLSSLAIVPAESLTHYISPQTSDPAIATQAGDDIDGSDQTPSTEDSPMPTPMPTDPDEDDDGGNGDDDDDPPVTPTTPPHEFSSDLIIAAINPGYGQTVTKPDGTSKKLSDVGELIVLQNLTDAPLMLAGYSLYFSKDTDSGSLLYTFPEGSYLVGKFLLLRYRSSPDYANADINYRAASITQKGILELRLDDEPIDTACWIGEDEDTGCRREFKNTTKIPPSVLVRDLTDGSFQHLLVADYDVPEFDPNIANFIIPEDPDDEDPSSIDDPDATPLAVPKCRDLEITELLTYYASDKSEQFIELFNPTSADIDTTGCAIDYKNKSYPLSGNVPSGGYYAFYNSELFALTKNPKNPSIVTLVDADGEPIDEVAYPNGQKKSTSYAKIYDSTGAESWQITYAITPGVENAYQKFRTCEEGKVINEATGNCVKVTSLSTSAKTLADTALAPCPAGKYRNPLTGRCKNIETTSTLKECAEGYERNPETNRCRKIATTNDGADFALTPTTSTSSQTVFIGFSIVAIIVMLGVVYITLQFRHEIARTLRKTRQRLNHIRKDLLARAIGRHRNK